MSTNKTATRYSVVVPVYESDRSLVELVDRLQRVFTQQIVEPYEIILVDDGSRSSTTWQTCEQLAHTHAEVIAIRLMRNYGRPSAILCGLSRSRGHFVITIDDDLQQRPEDILTLIRYQSHDVVVANFHSRQHNILAVWGSWVKNAIDRLVLGVPCSMSPLLLFNAAVARGMLQIRTPYPHIPALLAAVTQDFAVVIVPHLESHHGKSRYTFARRIKQFSNLLINNSTLLLRGLGLLGGIGAISGLMGALILVGRRFSGIPVLPGWTSLMVLILLCAGLILLALGIIGEYLFRLLEGISNKPTYLVRSIVGEQAEGNRTVE
jgi:glycosyltransferase involved in cell wall biosynthesis